MWPVHILWECRAVLDTIQQFEEFGVEVLEGLTLEVVHLHLVDD